MLTCYVETDALNSLLATEYYFGSKQPFTCNKKTTIIKELRIFTAEKKSDLRKRK
jgi:hypothetical protein